MNQILIGRYISGTSVLHKLDPRSKFLFSLGFFILIFQMQTVGDYILVQLFLIFVMLLSRISWLFLFRSLRPFLWFIVLFALFQLFVTDGGTVLFSIISWEITSNGVKFGLAFALRFLDILMITTLLTLTTTPMEMTHGLSRLLKPLKRLGVATDTIAFMVALTLRFIPTFMDEAEILLKAQASRGMDFEEGNIVQKLKGVTSIVILLFIQMFKRVDTIAVALDARGFQQEGTRTNYRKLEWKSRDTGCMIVAGILCICIIGF